MHNILRAFATASSLLMEASDDQIDKRGRLKAISTVWAEMPRMSGDLIRVAEELLDDPTLAFGDSRENEEKWLKAVIDEVSTTTDEPQHSTEESWAALARFTAWLAFCLKQSSSYADDSEFGHDGFERVRLQLAEADEFERAVLTTAITEASTQMEATGSITSQQIVRVYDELIRTLQTAED